MAPEKRPVHIRDVIAAVEKALGEPAGSIKGIVCTVVYDNDTLGLFHNAPDLHVASEAFATAITTVAKMQGLKYDVELL